MTSLERLARTIALARHGTDAMWANYLESAKAVEKMMSETEAPETSETPSGHLRWKTVDYGPFLGDAGAWPMPVLQQMWYITSYRGVEVSQVEEWRDVPYVSD